MGDDVEGQRVREHLVGRHLSSSHVLSGLVDELVHSGCASARGRLRTEGTVLTYYFQSQRRFVLDNLGGSSTHARSQANAKPKDGGWKQAIFSTTYSSPRVYTRFSLNLKNEQVDAERDGRTRLARPNYQARTEAGKCSYSLFS